MTAQDVLIRLPQALFDQLQARAARRQRTVADEILDVLTGATPATEALPDELERVLAHLAHLDDATLWQTARSRIPSEASERLEALNLKYQRAGRTPPEHAESNELVHLYERSMLVRAQAIALLKQRGHDVSSLASSGSLV